MKDEQTIKELQELKEALAVVNRWQDTEDGHKLTSKITDEFLNVRTSHYRHQLTNVFNEEVNE